jgi:hypothetical protein
MPTSVPQRHESDGSFSFAGIMSYHTGFSYQRNIECRFNQKLI